MPDTVTPRDLLRALDTDAVRQALQDALSDSTARVVWLVDDEHRDDVRACVAGQTGVLCWQWNDGAHLHVTVDGKTPWKGVR